MNQCMRHLLALIGTLMIQLFAQNYRFQLTCTCHTSFWTGLLAQAKTVIKITNCHQPTFTIHCAIDECVTDQHWELFQLTQVLSIISVYFILQQLYYNSTLFKNKLCIKLEYIFSIIVITTIGMFTIDVKLAHPQKEPCNSFLMGFIAIMSCICIGIKYIPMNYGLPISNTSPTHHQSFNFHSICYQFPITHPLATPQQDSNYTLLQNVIFYCRFNRCLLVFWRIYGYNWLLII